MCKKLTGVQIYVQTEML